MKIYSYIIYACILLSLACFKVAAQSAEHMLIPAPREIRYQSGHFQANNCAHIYYSDSSLLPFAQLAATWLPQKNILLQAGTTAITGKPAIYLRLQDTEASKFSTEGYTLKISPAAMIVTAGTLHGMHNALQTLRQLLYNPAAVPSCEITDWPAFGWRGYMIDVGRNYMPLAMLKEQIDIMAMYKMNIFHFHATEDIAWRLAIDKYPQLTHPDFMERDKGLYYSKKELQELIGYCKARFITLVPEIDMPGHSAAFKRAMGADMQSDSGMQYVKEILKEFCNTYDVPYIHIGADEVKITNKAFIPEMTQLVESYGKQVIGWQPGGNFSESTLRQLWMDDNAHVSGKDNVRFIDSRHLYLNHMDPLESVTTLFHRRIGDMEQATQRVLGGTLCVWHDRAVANPEDILRMNPVYPGMVAFAERSWQGGGREGWIANISDGDTVSFKKFEERLLTHKLRYFRQKPFPYVRQSHLRWKLYGPFNNEGNPAKMFSPETDTSWESNLQAAGAATGGTIVLRHWWAPLIKGALENPRENSTWYATLQLWSPENTTLKAWIGFNNISRSPNTDSPPAGKWDYKHSSIWINGTLIPPPEWNRPGQKGHSEIPLTDEDYAYRAPHTIRVKAGWNRVLLKLPVTGFKGPNWHNPVKWMFTFVPVE